MNICEMCIQNEPVAQIATLYHYTMGRRSEQREVHFRVCGACYTKHMSTVDRAITRQVLRTVEPGQTGLVKKL